MNIHQGGTVSGPEPSDMRTILNASGVFEAELACSILREREIPASVLDGCMSHWLWYARLGLTRGGVRVVVPAGQVEEARLALEDARRAGREMSQEVPDDFDERADAAWLGGATLGVTIYLSLFTLVGILLSPWLLWRGFRQLGRAASEDGPPLTGWARFHYTVGWGLLIVSVASVCLVGWTLVRELWRFVNETHGF
jgi:hypothetical protein